MFLFFFPSFFSFVYHLLLRFLEKQSYKIHKNNNYQIQYILFHYNKWMNCAEISFSWKLYTIDTIFKITINFVYCYLILITFTMRMENCRRNYLPVLYSPFPHSQLLEKNGYIAVSPHGKLTIVGFPPFNSQINPTENLLYPRFSPCFTFL